MKHAKSLLVFLLSSIILLTSCSKTNKRPLPNYHDSASNSDWVVDSVKKTITPLPLIGNTDASPEIQACIQYQALHPGYIITPAAGDFYLYENLVAAVLNTAGQPSQAYIYMVGASDARDANNAYTTNFHVMNTSGFGIGIQQGKGCWIENIHFIGVFGQTNQFRIASLNAVQVDTTAYASWDDGVCSNNATSPYTAIAIDFASDPANYDGVRFKMYPGESQWYVPGMTKSGSTDINIVNCRAEGFVVGFVVTPSFQQNGDNINFTNCRVDNCRDGFAFTQSQSKGCTITNPISWGQTANVFNGIDYGCGRADGSTFASIIGGNIAGNTCQIFRVMAKSFPLSAINLFADNVYKVGYVVGLAGVSFVNLQIGLQVNAVGVPSPDYYYYGFMTTWTGCMVRVYNNGTNGVFNRIPLNMAGNLFTGGMMSSPPICQNQEDITHSVQPGIYPTVFDNVEMYYTFPSELSVNGYDSAVNLAHLNGGFYYTYTVPVTIDPATFTGSFTCADTVGKGITVGDALCTFKNYVEILPSLYYSYEYPLGYATKISRGATTDTVYMRNTGQNIYTGNYAAWDMKIKTSIY